MTSFVDVTLTDIAYNGPAIGRLDGQVLFADYGIPGERARIEIETRKKDYLIGRVIEVLEPSPHRVEPPCPYFGRCGGCQWQHIAYPHQLELKAAVVRQQFRRIGKLPDAPVRPTLPSPDEWHYRNHVRFGVTDRGELGFHMRRSHRLIRVDECPISHPRINGALAELQGKCAWMEHLDVRIGAKTGDLLVSPEATASHPSDSGQSALHEELHGRRFRISEDSFFQANTAVAETLVDLVMDALALQGGERVVDAYAGVGTFACFLSERAEQVMAVEESGPAVADARFNVEALGLTNVDIRHGAVERVLPRVEGEIDAIVLDPPRTGCDRGVVSAILERPPGIIAYVSCDPATLARDVKLLVEGGYRLDWVQPVDQFPQTYHIEAVTRLVWQGT